GRSRRTASRARRTRRRSASASAGGRRATAACGRAAAGGRWGAARRRYRIARAASAGMLTAGSMRAAAVQLNTGPDPDANLAQANEHVRAAAADGARLVVLPEKWNVLGSPADLRAGAEPLDGRAVRWMC